jgi:hypothetical protein
MQPLMRMQDDDGVYPLNEICRIAGLHVHSILLIHYSSLPKCWACTSNSYHESLQYSFPFYPLK